MHFYRHIQVIKYHEELIITLVCIHNLSRNLPLRRTKVLNYTHYPDVSVVFHFRKTRNELPVPALFSVIVIHLPSRNWKPPAFFLRRPVFFFFSMAFPRITSADVLRCSVPVTSAPSLRENECDIGCTLHTCCVLLIRD